MEGLNFAVKRKYLNPKLRAGYELWKGLGSLHYNPKDAPPTARTWQDEFLISDPRIPVEFLRCLRSRRSKSISYAPGKLILGYGDVRISLPESGYNDYELFPIHISRAAGYTENIQVQIDCDHFGGKRNRKSDKRCIDITALALSVAREGDSLTVFLEFGDLYNDILKLKELEKIDANPDKSHEGAVIYRGANGRKVVAAEQKVKRIGTDTFQHPQLVRKNQLWAVWQDSHSMYRSMPERVFSP